MFKMLFSLAVLIGGGAFNVSLYANNEGVNIYSEKSKSGWEIDCRYYTPVRFFVVQINTGRTCPGRVSLR
ncbi:MAG: hypothetical protein JWL62_3904 [Hyphomicrobiales bacterium]|nr:hypothetical protein [Hyphomicrobiales bacterium]